MSSDTPELRHAARAIVLDPEGRVLLVRFTSPAGETWWATVGGGLDEGETHEQALKRELAEEAGIEAEPGPWVWKREHSFDWHGRRLRQVERFYLMRVSETQIAPGLSSEQLAAEGVDAVRWWAPAELDDSTETFAPSRLPELLRSLVRDGPPAEPFDVGV